MSDSEESLVQNKINSSSTSEKCSEETGSTIEYIIENGAVEESNNSEVHMEVDNNDCKEEQVNKVEGKQTGIHDKCQTGELDEHSDTNDETTEKPATKRRLSIITISDTESDDSSVCLVDSYQASASEAKRLRKGYSSSGSSSASSVDDSEPEGDNPIPVISYTPSLLSKCNAALKTRAPRLSEANLNPCFISDEKEKQFLEHWTKRENFTCENLTLDPKPFRLCVLDNFLVNSEIINNIIDDMTTLDWSKRKMDLYEFHRSTDLVNLSWQRAIKSFYNLLKDEVMKWVARITNLKLTHVSASCALYGPGDHLLPHDDLMADRKVAFIYYMAPWNIPESTSQLNITDTVVGIKNDSEDKSKQCIASNSESIVCKDIKQKEENNDETCRVENKKQLEEGSEAKDSDKVEQKENSCNADGRLERGWTKLMGGELELFTTDENGLPTVVVKSLLPSNNTFAFFKVGTNTFHKVSEVMSFDFPRLTINGWFHGPPEEGEENIEHVEDISTVSYKDLKKKPHQDMYQSSLNQWIASTYLSPRTKYRIQQQIENTSEISLEDFFLNEQYDAIMECLQNETLTWKPRGPAHLRHYDVLSVDSAGEAIKEMLQLFNSHHFIRLLGEFTDLRFSTYHSLELQRWTAGSYLILPPKSHSEVTELDTILYLGLPNKRFNGGDTIYIAPEDDNSEPLITIEPLNNSLNLVYSDSGTTKFTKYVNKLGFREDEHFYILTCSYRE